MDMWMVLWYGVVFMHLVPGEVGETSVDSHFVAIAGAYCYMVINRQIDLKHIHSRINNN